jgi:predicted HNH restriction endonuclease
MLRARPSATRKERLTVHRVRSRAVHRYVLRRADAQCEGCNAPAPFRKTDGQGYLEPHHTTRLSDDGPDHPTKVIALCPNCHRRAHYSRDAEAFNSMLIRKLRRLERG